MVPVVDPDPLAVSALPTPDSWEWFSETGKRRAPTWSNEVTLRSVEMLMEYEPSAYLERISPTPLLIVVAAGDHLTPSDLALEAYQRAREPKQLVLLPGRPLRRLRRRTSTPPAARPATGSSSTWAHQVASKGPTSRIRDDQRGKQSERRE